MLTIKSSLISPILVLILSSNLHLDLPSSLFSSGFLIISLCAFLFYPTRPQFPAIESSFTSLSDFCINTIRNFIHPPLISSLSDPNIILVTLLSKMYTLCCSFEVRDQVPHTQTQTTDKIVLCIIYVIHNAHTLTNNISTKQCT